MASITIQKITFAAGNICLYLSPGIICLFPELQRYREPSNAAAARAEGEGERRPNWCEQRVYVTRMENDEAKGKGDSRNERESDTDGYSLHLTASLTVDIPFHLARVGMYHITISNQRRQWGLGKNILEWGRHCVAANEGEICATKRLTASFLAFAFET